MTSRATEAFLREYGTRWCLNGWELHCGDCFQVEDPTTSTWVDVRIEHAAGIGWYLVGLPSHLRDAQLSNLKARSYP
jgi:hypothetical protein